MPSILTCCGVISSTCLATLATAGGGGAFTDTTASAGITAVHSPTYSHGFLAGGAVGDFDGDGWQDIFVPIGGGSPDRLYMNNQDGTFTDRASDWGIAVAHRSTAAAVADYDGDGRLDIYVTSLGPAGFDQVGHHRLYRNTGVQSFIDQAALAGVNQSSPTVPDGFGACWGDYDLDGDADLCVAGWNDGSGNRLFRNNGNGGFTDVTNSVGLSQIASIVGFAPRFADMDGDRYPELIFIGDFSTSRYYRNDGDGTFTDWTTQSGTSLDGTEMGATVADWDEDGDFDFYVTTIGTNNLYVNQGGNVFLNRASQTGTVDTGWGWATVAIDFNHDTLVDIVATSQSSGQFAFMNTMTNGNLSFSEVSNSIGLISGVSGRGLSNFDYDNDGDQDLVIFPRSGPVTLFRNDIAGAGTNWLRVALDRGAETGITPAGIGSIVRLTHSGRTFMGRVDGGSNYLTQSELTAHFGLGSVTTVDEVVVEWTDGSTTTLTDVAANQTLVVVAGAVTPGDANGDGIVDVSDLLAVLASFGDCDIPCPPGCDSDFDDDCDVDVNDLLTVLANWS